VSNGEFLDEALKPWPLISGLSFSILMRACDDCGGIDTQLRQQAKPVAINITGQIILRTFIRLNRLNAGQIHFQRTLCERRFM
jgi:hypothetical protein